MPRAGFAAAVIALAIAAGGAQGASAATLTCTPQGPATVASGGSALYGVACTTMPSGTVIDAMPQHGTLVHVFGGLGQLRYTPDPGYAGPDTFTYHAYRGDDVSAPITQQVTVGVNTPPSCDTPGDPTPVRAGRPHTFELSCRDPDGSPLTVEIMSAPSRGTLSPVVPVGIHFAVTYEVTSPGGEDAFSYRVSDGSAWSATQTVRIRALGAENAVPVCQGETLTVKPGQTIGIADWRCTDADLDPLTLQVLTPPAKGTLQVTQPGGPAPGGFAYTAAADATGTDAFTFTATDGTATAAPATIRIAIDDGSTPPPPGPSPTEPPPTTTQPGTPPPSAGPPPAPRPRGLTALTGVRLGPSSAAFLPAGAGGGVVELRGARPAALLVLTCGARCEAQATPRLVLGHRRGAARTAASLRLPTQRLAIRAGGRATVKLALTRAQRAALGRAGRARVRLKLAVRVDGQPPARDAATVAVRRG